MSAVVVHASARELFPLFFGMLAGGFFGFMIGYAVAGSRS